MNNSAKVIISLIVIALATLALIVISNQKDEPAEEQPAYVASFEECAAAGNPIMESFPRQCEANGVTFTEETETDPVICTMEAKQCPDGSYVGRQGPACEFAPCPGN